MNRPYMRDMLFRDPRMIRDGRNPYGSRGGYITSRDPRRRDRAGYRGEYDMAHEREMEYPKEHRQDRHGFYPFEVMGRVGYEEMYDPRYEEDMMYDYARGKSGRYIDGRYDYAGAEMLSNRELMEWSQKLLQEVEEKDKALFKYETIEKKAKDMGIKFDEFSFDEFYTTVLMVFTDYCKTLGTANIDIYLRLAKDWLCDEDVAVKYGEKLAYYYDYVVMGM